MERSRLFEIVYILLERGNVTAKELAERFEVSPRTIYRDIDTLSLAGIPLYTSKGKGGGIYILNSNVLDKSLLDEKEQREILFALQGLRAVNGMEEESLLSHLQQLFQKKDESVINMDFTGWDTKEKEKEKFRIIKQAILEHRILHFSYYSAEHGKSMRKVEPVRLQFKGAAWYLQGYCHAKNDFRTFKISRIEELEETAELGGKWKEGIPEFPSMFEQKECIMYELLFKKEVAYRVYDEFPYESITKQEDGTYLVHIEYAKDANFVDYFLSFGTNLLIKSPEDVRNNLIRRAKDIMMGYTKEDEG